ncbi:ADP-ribosylglycohydrolase family protein [Haploplasma axanthum]|nr:ADP-ribosylglycohydrolase family protein [Haploplasma axanthum]
MLRQISSVIYMALNCKNKQEIKEYINDNYYVLDKTCNEIRKSYTFNETCMGTVPEAIESFLESTCYEDAIRIAISLGGDADTIGAITGSMAEAYYGIPESIEEKCFEFLDKESKDISRRMIYKRESVANRYLETKGQLFKEGFFFARYSVSDMDGRPNSRQKNFMFTYNNKRYECRNGLDFIVVNEDSSTNRMNENEFMFFIDEIRLFLYRRFSMFIGSVEDAYANTLLELSNNFWKGKKE